MTAQPIPFALNLIRNPFALSLSKGFVPPAAQAQAERSRSLSPRSNAHVRGRSSHLVALGAPE